MKVAVKGVKTKNKASYETKDSESGYFGFYHLKPDTYNLTAKKSDGQKKHKIKLERNTDYFFYIDW